MGKRFYIKISGAAFDIPAKSPEEAIELIRKCTDAYCSFNVLEIGVDVDEKGWPVEKAEAK